MRHFNVLQGEVPGGWSGPGKQMELILQIALVIAMVAYLWQRHVDLNQRNRESSAELLIRVQAELGTQDLGEGTSWLSLQAITGVPRNWRELWKLYCRAGLVMRMADHADLAAEVMALDPTMLIRLRRDAMQLRISALTAMAGYAFQK